MNYLRSQRKAIVNWSLGIVTAGLASSVWAEETACKLVQKDHFIDAKVNLKELSGIDRSRRFDDLYWVHNDGKNEPAIFGINDRGEVLTKIALKATNTDWEDLTTGSCGDDTCIYIADFGNNKKRRDVYNLKVLREPDVLSSSYESEARVLTFSYPDKGRYDAEALAFNEKEGQLFSIRKTTKGDNILYSFPKTLGSNMVLSEVCNFADIGSGQVTGADISDDGTRILIRTYGEIREYKSTAIDESICGSLSWVSKFKEQGYKENQGETVAYTKGDQGFVTISEGRRQPVHKFACE